jgi:glycine cleavage system H protein
MGEEYVEFTIVGGRSYTRNHLWLQLLDKEEGTWKMGVTDCLVKDLGEVLRVIPSEVDEEVSSDDVLFSLRAATDKISLDSPCSGTIIEVNNELEATPEMVSDDPYGDGWVVIMKPHGLNEEEFLTPDEYIESLQE